VRRRPSGEPPALRREARWTRWIAVLAGVVVIGLAINALARWTGVVDTIDQSVASWLADVRMPGVADALRPLGLLTSMATVMGLRWIAVLVLLVQRRIRHAVVFVLTFVGMDWAVARLLHFPSAAVSALAITLFSVVMAFTTRGRARRNGLLAATLVLALVTFGRLYLGSDLFTGSVYGVALAAGVATVMFRWLAPEESFPVADRRGTVAAHLDLAGERRTAIVRAMADQLGLTEPTGRSRSARTRRSNPSWAVATSRSRTAANRSS
jgi:hypothetical protein